jgi:glucose/mannose-6-phosphate isomerase
MTREPDDAALDDLERLEAADPAGMLLAIASGAAQVREASAGAAEVDLTAVAADGRPRAFVVAGMGGSAIAGDALVALAGTAVGLPVVTVRSYELPGWVGAADLVVGVSCSGTTEETLAVMGEALRRGCRLAGVGATGSPLEHVVLRGRGPFVSVNGGGRQPRANMWALTVPLLALARAAGVLDVPAAEIDAAAGRLADISHLNRPSSESFVNPAKTFALQLAGSLPVVWGGSPVAAVAAYRWQGQFAENAKYPLISGAVPEANHNQVVTFDGAFAARDPADIFADPDETSATRLRLVLLRDPAEHPRVALRMDASRELAESRGIPVTEVGADGESPIERLASLVAYGDYVSAYLAIALGIDPTPVDTITALKTRIARA